MYETSQQGLKNGEITLLTEIKLTTLFREVLGRSYLFGGRYENKNFKGCVNAVTYYMLL